MFRENEICTFYCNTAHDGILYDEAGTAFGLKDCYIELKLLNCGQTENAICLQNFQQPVKLDTGHYGIPLKNTLYKLSHFTTLATAKPSIVLFAFSFNRIDDTFTDEDAYIFTNKNTSRGVTILRKALNILGAADRLELHYIYDDWNTMIIQYSLITNSEQDECSFMLNGRRVFFSLVL